MAALSLASPAFSTHFSLSLWCPSSSPRSRRTGSSILKQWLKIATFCLYGKILARQIEESAMRHQKYDSLWPIARPKVCHLRATITSKRQRANKASEGAVLSFMDSCAFHEHTKPYVHVTSKQRSFDTRNRVCVSTSLFKKSPLNVTRALWLKVDRGATHRLEDQ